MSVPFNFATSTEASVGSPILGVMLAGLASVPVWVLLAVAVTVIT